MLHRFSGISWCPLLTFCSIFCDEPPILNTLRSILVFSSILVTHSASKSLRQLVQYVISSSALVGVTILPSHRILRRSSLLASKTLPSVCFFLFFTPRRVSFFSVLLSIRGLLVVDLSAGGVPWFKFLNLTFPLFLILPRAILMASGPSRLPSSPLTLLIRVLSFVRLSIVPHSNKILNFDSR